ncbi:transcription elongation factor GreA [bacterium]|nr:transcription elongation factor GreA [bacterium]
MSYITPYGMQQIQRRINELLTERPDVLKAISIAREMGDLSENAEYKSAKERQREIDNEVTYLKIKSSKLKVLDPTTIAKDKVRFGAIIEAQEIGSDEIITYYLVGSDEVNFPENDYTKISVESPIGKGFIGKAVNDIALVKAPKGERKFKILSIK